MRLKIDDRFEVKILWQERPYECKVTGIYYYMWAKKTEKAYEVEVTYSDDGSSVGLKRISHLEVCQLEKAGMITKINCDDE